MPTRNKPEKDNTALRVAFMLTAFLIIVGGYYIIAMWMRPPAVSFDNLEYIQLLRTAVSSQRLDYVTKVDEAISGRKSEGKMSDAEWNHFQSIIATAKAGDWSEADKACIKFEYAQLDRKREASQKEHTHSH
jgi:hypothetical protein